MTDPLMQKVDCVRLYVPDLDAGLAFYRDQLGHQVIWRSKDAVGLRLPDTDAEIVLQTERHEPEIDFKVQSAKAAADWFATAGGTILVAPFDIKIGQAVVVQDPRGNRFVLLDMSKGRLVTDAGGNIIGNETGDEPTSG